MDEISGEKVSLVDLSNRDGIDTKCQPSPAATDKNLAIETVCDYYEIVAGSSP